MRANESPRSLAGDAGAGDQLAIWQVDSPSGARKWKHDFPKLPPDGAAARFALERSWVRRFQKGNALTNEGVRLIDAYAVLDPATFERVRAEAACRFELSVETFENLVSSYRRQSFNPASPAPERAHHDPRRARL
jgi:hypothetical protein